MSGYPNCNLCTSRIWRRNCSPRAKPPRTVQHVHRVLRKALNDAIKWGLLWRNPADAVDTPKVEDPGLNVPQTEDVLKILDLARDTPYHGALHFLAYTGCRTGECLGLRREAVVLARRTASRGPTAQGCHAMRRSDCM